MRENTQKLLRIKDIQKHFGGVIALNGVSLDVEPGGITGLIGPNGSGKSTLFNIITGFLRPNRGETVFAGERLNGLSPDRIALKGLFRSFQMSLQPKKMTVMENILLCPSRQEGESLLGALLRPAEVRRQERANREKAFEILETVNLADKANTLVGSLSGGQKKLLSLAQALMVGPKLILLDEPVAGVNPRLIEDISRALLQLKEQGQNFLIVEHNMKFVRQVCDVLHVLDAGDVIASGPTLETLKREEVLEAYLAKN
ncbi:MAG: ABC transporter ATP-binding protein [Desulfohalobiaceae bacterium]